MAIRSSWKGYLKLSLVSVPLKAYTASSGSTAPSITLNQLHEACHSRIKYKKTCPVHGEIPNDEIVSGYEFAKGQYVIVDSEEIEKLRSESDKSITVEAFVGAGSIDPVYHSGQTYYLLPDGPVGQKPYLLIQQSMAEENLHGIGQVVLSGRERLVLLRPMERLIAMTVLQYAAQVKTPTGFEDELVDAAFNKQEVKLTKDLLSVLTRDDFDLAEYTDSYVEKMTRLIEAKVEGKELVTPPAAEEPQIINLMDALKESVKRVKVPQTAAARRKPARKMATSARSRGAKKKATKKKRSG